MAFATVIAVHMIAERTQPVMPNGEVPQKVSLQRRDGPDGFDGVVVEWQRNDTVGTVFVQSKRPISLSDTETFRKLARALAVCDRVRPVSHFALVPAVARWFRKPIIPCTADTIIAGERKDLGNALASKAGLQIPRAYGPHEFAEAQAEARLIVKPPDLGGSFGLKSVEGKTLDPSDFDGGKIVQAFVPGFDVTVPVFVDANTNTLNVGDATVYVPNEADPTEWIYDRQAKEAYPPGISETAKDTLQIPANRAPSDTAQIPTFSSHHADRRGSRY